MRDDALTIIACGSNAAIGLPAYLMRLGNELDLGLRVLLTHSAQRFVSPQVVAWHADEVFTSDDPSLNPTELAQRSIGIVVLPATANMLASAALGLAATPGQTALLAASGPSLFFPQLNPAMWAKAPTRRHVESLRADGHVVVDPEERQIYELWRRSFTVGPAMAPPDQAVEIILEWLEKALADQEAD
ncbi:flavoprotein [Lentzea sp. NPDC059081]|uniref:flavoprotein n=1 Tax=Lentzea sp. NPDC059081 TaxID=3346719 RepID=UPI003692542A